MPDHMTDETSLRKSPVDILCTSFDMGEILLCSRAMMPEPHVLNSSILDCCVSFTVDRSICIRGLEVPSQVHREGSEETTSQGEGDEEDNNSTTYNELLYAHILDSEGSRLSYTHLTTKVSYHSATRIHFNKPLVIEPHKPYRIGIVLNKVGWYPSGVCTRRVLAEGCFFTFGESIRDGLIRAIYFSK
eukprot:TRINITY_DN307_c2_g1_i1.p1 TRINITY_DN307_c2_g1~~TRINITY_DN307_c2_g1_i1.p1  ORF type:complete len:195 (-),score=66.14 TRINITY_DN307_c2_g1_i1:1191-1754(-)